jgi:hypothetical protein
MSPATVVFVLLFMFLVLGGPWALVRLVEGKRKFLLDMKKQEARIAEAKAKELEIAHKRQELEYREALLELERFDRRSGRERGRADPELDPPGQGMMGG